MACLRLLLLWLVSCNCGNGEKVALNFSYITARTGSYVTAGTIPVVDLALELINNRSDILPNYTLQYTEILDSQVRVLWMMKLASQHVM